MLVRLEQRADFQRRVVAEMRDQFARFVCMRETRRGFVGNQLTIGIRLWPKTMRE